MIEQLFLFWFLSQKLLFAIIIPLKLILTAFHFLIFLALIRISQTLKIYLFFIFQRQSLIRFQGTFLVLRTLEILLLLLLLFFLIFSWFDFLGSKSETRKFNFSPWISIFTHIEKNILCRCNSHIAERTVKIYIYMKSLV